MKIKSQENHPSRLVARDEILEEYRTLRTESIALQDRQSQNANLAWTGTIALIGTAAVAKVPERAILSIAFIATMWLGHLHLSAGIRRIGAYIESQIEPKLEGLHWERTWRKQYRETNASRSLFKRLRIAISSNYGMFSIVALASSVAFLLSSHSMSCTRIASNLALMLLTILWLLRVIVKAVNHPLRQTTFLITNSSPAQSVYNKS